MEGWWRVLKITTERNVCLKESLIEVARPQLLRPAKARAPHRIVCHCTIASSHHRIIRHCITGVDYTAQSTNIFWLADTHVSRGGA
jgi:hypothetical protein